ncbi:MAG: signal peptidase I [Patescibacteria group bacterium]
MLFRRSGDTTPVFVRWFGPSVGAAALFIAEIVQVVAVALIIIFAVRYFLIKPFVVKGASMEPNFYDSEYLIVDELTYRFRQPERGEVVVFHPPEHPNSTEQSDQYYIKRIIGLPGETVEIHDGVITISNTEHPNGFVLDESYISEYTDGDIRRVVPVNDYFLLGDNRTASLDSRVFGPVPIDNIVGKVWFRGFPLDRAATIASPTYTIESQ